MDEGRIRKIVHVDMDAFYASVEQRDNATEPSRVCRRLFRLSHAAMAGSSSVA